MSTSKTPYVSIQLICIWTILIISRISAFAQKPDIVVPGSASINTALLHTGSFVWERKVSELFSSSDKPKKPDERFVTISRTAKEITIEERIHENGKDVVKRKSVLHPKTFEPIRAQAETEEFSYNIEFGSSIKGSLENFKTGEKEKFNEPIEEKFFVGSSLEILISLLPLQEGYKAFIPQVTFDQGFRTKVMRWEIEKVQELKTPSCALGEIRDVLLVELSNTLIFSETYKIVLDKKTRRILMVIKNPGNSEKFYVDNEKDIQPLKTRFDANEARAMINQGTSNITGQAYTIDENMPKAMIGKPKKILAPKGSIVMLIPNTPYFQEWFNFNSSLHKKFPPEFAGKDLISGCAGYPLPLEVKEQTLLTEVTDNKGSFLFQNLKPGEYHVFVQFVATKYTHTTKTPTGGYSVTVNPDGTGSAIATMDVKHWGSPTNVSNYALVKISQEGEAVKVKLKD
jgi:hypothetical protein